ncbi:MAG: hypothetical protein ACRD3C_07235 [Vicinamibacterales bacterium]
MLPPFMQASRSWRGAVFVLVIQAASAAGAELQPRTVAAFDRYVRVTEALANRDVPFLWIDGRSDAERRATLERVHRGELVIERLTTRDDGKAIEVPGGLIHHWLGSVFVPKATVNQALTLLQNYDEHATIYRPAVARSRTLSHEGDMYRVFLRFFMKKVITVVVNSEHEARFSRPAPDRAQSRIYSVRIAEVENPDTPGEREKPMGQDGGYLWRLYTYWRFLERDGGTYVQCEAISLTRGIPTGFGWLIGPFVTSIPRESLSFTLVTTRTTLERQLAQRE